jgi:hypothetical protein
MKSAAKNVKSKKLKKKLLSEVRDQSKELSRYKKGKT